MTEHPIFQDDLDRQNLRRAVDQSLRYLRALPPDRILAHARRPVDAGQVTRSLEFFQKILERNLSDRQLQKALQQHFVILQAAEKNLQVPEILVTGYYQPVVKGSLTRSPPYIHPLYAVPPDLVVQAGKDGKKKIGRMDRGRLRPYWTRAEIDRQHRAAGSELAWLKDPLDVFFLHVQGSGVIELPDGSRRRLRFAAKNGHPYRSIGRYMVKTGRISLQEASMATIRGYIESHPQELEEILFTNPSYIFFQWADSDAVHGSLGRQLTLGRSIAADQGCFPAGGLAFLETRQPVIADNLPAGWQPVHRFVLVQDSGSAITGPGRVDLFLGTGAAAGAAAGVMKEPGRLFLLLLREDR
jgi:membrane-bound lytic murein transglycosylase A